MNIPNRQLPGAPTVDELETYKATASTAYANSKAAAAEAVANMYMLWKGAGSANASDATYNWLKGELDAFNDSIAKNNKDMETDSNLERQVGLGTVERDVSFTQIVKFVFDLKKPSEASTISRYAKVLELVERNETQLRSIDTDAIVTFIDERGGFEAALQEARDIEREAGQIPTLPTLFHDLRGLLGQSEPLATIAYNDNFVEDEFVVLLGRAASKQVKLLGRICIDDGATTELLENIEPKVLGPVQPMTGFVRQVSVLAQAISEGGKGDFTVDATKSGKPLTQERAYCLVPDANDDVKLLVSSRYVLASVAVEATPDDQSIVLGNVSKPITLMRKTSRQIEALLQSPITPYTQVLSAHQNEEGDTVWKLESVSASQQVLEWGWVEIEDHPPCRSVRPSHDVTETVKASDLLALVCDFDEFKKAMMDADTSTDKGTYKLAAGKKLVEFEIAKKSAVKVTVTLSMNKVSAHVEVNFYDLHKAIKQIALCANGNVKLSYSKNGLLWLEFSDAYGHYIVSVPALINKNKLNTDHFKMIDVK